MGHGAPRYVSATCLAADTANGAKGAGYSIGQTPGIRRALMRSNADAFHGAERALCDVGMFDALDQRRYIEGVAIGCVDIRTRWMPYTSNRARRVWINRRALCF
jgi:hypothetical protein